MDEEKFEDAQSTTNAEIVDEILSKSFAATKLNSENGASLHETEEQNSDDDEKNYSDCQNDLIDDELQKECEKNLSKEQREFNIERAETLKKEGNDLFIKGNYSESVEIYTTALKVCPVESSKLRSFLYGNRAAAKEKLQAKGSAIEDCTKAIEFNPTYIKVLLRRAKLFEDTNKLEESLEDYKKILEFDKSHKESHEAVYRLSKEIEEKNEKLKEEMMEKLKELGNMCLKPFGLSTNNFNMQKDPNTGSYSINFKQN